MEKINRYGEGNCCPNCGSKKITKLEQRNLQVEVNLATGKPFKMVDGKIRNMSNREKALAFDTADMAGGGGCWAFECRKCGWKSETFTE